VDRQRHVDEYLCRNLYRRDEKSIDRCVDTVENMLLARAPKEGSDVMSLLNGRNDLLCSVIIPLCSCDGASETLLGVAENTPAELSYECLIGTSLAPAERGEFINSLGGDLEVLQSNQSGIGSLYNLAAARAMGRYLCFLSPGWVPQNGWLEALVNQLEVDTEVGVAGGMALFADGLVAHAGIALDANLSPVLIYRRLPAMFPGANRIRKMRAVMGCLIVRREAFLAAGGFDEAYRGNWCELDFCFQVGLKGWKVVYTPASLFICLNGQNSPPADDRLRFFAKWVGQLWPDQESYWAQDQLDPAKLSNLYQQVLDGPPSAVETLTT
jgi:hypothetical protein